MATTKKTLKTCPKGHTYYKSSDCPTCPACEREKKPTIGFLSLLSAPARRALENNGITTLKQLAKYSEADIMEFHGIGKAVFPILREALEDEGLAFKEVLSKNSVQSMTKSSEPEKVDAYLKLLDHPLLKVVEALRKLILSTDTSIGEEIAWNAPSFFYTGEMAPFNAKDYKRHIVVFNLHKKDCIRLIFISGAKVKDTSGLLEGNYTDGRRIASIMSLEDLKAKEKELKKVIKKWLTLVND